jgi:uncharacterized protein YjiS (DUF1127 family)
MTKAATSRNRAAPNYNRSRSVPGGDAAVTRKVENSAINILQESTMPSNNSRAARMWSDSRHDALSGREIAIEDIDSVAAAHRGPVLVPHPEPITRRIPSIAPESAEEADRPPVSSLSVVFAYLMEGFVLYGASIHPNGFPVELPRLEDHVARPAEELPPPRERPAVVPNSAGPTAAQIEQTPGDAGVTLADVGLLEFGAAASAGAVRRVTRRLRNFTAVLWANWRREREMKKAVRDLSEFDDRTLRDMGISQRSLIEQTVRHGRDC